MTTKAEKEGVKLMAKAMSTKDLKWQIAHGREMRIPADLIQAFKDELASRPK